MINIISIIVPTYNRASIIGRTINNLLEQSFINFEIIIIDDCSTDDTEQIIKQFDDNRIRYYKNVMNKGACYSRNRGIMLASGEYIAFQDSDDLWKTNKLKEQLRYLKEKNADIVFCQMEQFNEQGIRISTIPDRLIENNTIDYPTLLNGNLISTQTILGKRECFKNIAFDESLPRFQDWDLVLRLSQKYKIIFQNSIFVTQFLQKDSISKNYYKAVEGLKIIYSKYYTENNNKDSNFYYWNLLGTCQYQIKDPAALKSFIKAFKYNKTLKSLIKIILCKVHLLNFFVQVK